MSDAHSKLVAMANPAALLEDRDNWRTRAETAEATLALKEEALAGSEAAREGLQASVEHMAEVLRKTKVRIAFIGHPGEPWRGERGRHDLLGDNGPDWSDVCDRIEAALAIYDGPEGRIQAMARDHAESYLSACVGWIRGEGVHPPREFAQALAERIEREREDEREKLGKTIRCIRDANWLEALNDHRDVPVPLLTSEIRDALNEVERRAREDERRKTWDAAVEACAVALKVETGRFEWECCEQAVEAVRALLGKVPK